MSKIKTKTTTKKRKATEDLQETKKKKKKNQETTDDEEEPNRKTRFEALFEESLEYQGALVSYQEESKAKEEAEEELKGALEFAQELLKEEVAKNKTLRYTNRRLKWGGRLLRSRLLRQAQLKK